MNTICYILQSIITIIAITPTKTECLKLNRVLFVARMLGPPIGLVLLDEGIAGDKVAGDGGGFDPTASTPTLSGQAHGD